MRKFPVFVCLLLCASACGGASNTENTTTTVVSTTTVAPTTTKATPSTTTVVSTTTVASTTTTKPYEPSEVFEQSRWVSSACDQNKILMEHQIFIPEVSSKNSFNALIDPAPEGLDFWIPPDPIPGRNGDVIWARHDADLEGGTAYLILYRSESVCGEPRAVSAWIAVPDEEPSDLGRPVVSWGHGTRGAGDHCAATRSGYMYQEEMNGVITGLLTRGFVIVASDYEGSGTPGTYAWGQSSALGKNVLDAARAAQNFQIAKANKKTFLTGFSIGGHVMSKANEIADVYSPDVELLGLLGILAGVVQSDWSAEMLMRSSYTRGYMVFGAAVEQAIWGEELAPASRRLTDLGISHLHVLESQCMTESNDYFAQFEAEELFKFPFDPKFTNGVDPSVVNAIGQKKGSAPVILIHPTTDPAIPPAAIIEYVEKVCEFGQPILIHWLEEGVMHSLEMIATQEVLSAFFDFIEARLAGGSIETHCGNIPDLPGGDTASASVGVPCNFFDSQENAEIFFNENPEFGAGLDTNGDGVPCGIGDEYGLIDCGDGTTLLGHRCWFSLVQNCNNFQTQAEAQEWFDIQTGDTGAVDQNEDGIACGSGDYMGVLDCENGLVLARFCEGSTDNSNFQEETTISGIPDNFAHGCGIFPSQEDAQIWFKANLDFGENVDTNNDGTACGQGDYGGLNKCLNSEGVVVLDHLCGSS